MFCIPFERSSFSASFDTFVITSVQVLMFKNLKERVKVCTS